jgi:hypothetical protein
MKHLKVLGLVIAAAAVLAALTSAGAASATVLCKTSLTEGCGVSGWDYPGGTSFDASLSSETTMVLRSTGGSLEDTCSGGTIRGDTENTGSVSETVRVTITETAYEGCSKPTKVLEPHCTGEFHWISGTDNATLTTTTCRWTVESLSGVSCVYSGGTGTNMGTATGGNPGVIDVNAVVNKAEGGFLCPADSVLELRYTITAPVPTYFARS